jgi:AcrR family transcriptional regulator
VRPAAPDRAQAEVVPDQRSRILETALRLMAARGVHAMGMRSLADECGLNVATLYHYFGSKRELFDAVIAHQNYQEQLVELPPVDAERPAAARLADLLEWIWLRMGEHDDMWKLLLGESLRGETPALVAAADLSATFERALDRWLEACFPELPGAATRSEERAQRSAAPGAGARRINARVLRGLIYGFFIETMPLPRADRRDLLAQRAQEIASVFLPSS